MESYKNLRDGHNNHYLDHKPIIFRTENGELAKTDKNVADGLAMHFKDVCNIKVVVDWDFIDNIPKKSVLNCIGDLVSFPELGTFFYRLAWYEALSDD